MAKVKTFTNPLQVFQVMEELENLDAQVNQFIEKNNIKKIISVGDTTTTDNSGATIGIIRVVAYE
jgi:hypothetical protein